MAQLADQINYTPPFRKSVGGTLFARFRSDANGEPQYDADEDDARLHHYYIDLYLDSPNASRITSVNYFMDDPSYESDPEGSSEDHSNLFPLPITSYGDVEVVVTVHLAGDKYQQRAWLSNMLENGHRDDLSPTERDALRRIKLN